MNPMHTNSINPIKGPVIAIDGTAGTGKSTISRLLAERLRFTYVDTGAMYRAIAVKAREEFIDIKDDEQLKILCSKTKLHFQDNKIFVDGRDYSNEIRSPIAGELSSKVSANKSVREEMVRQQRLMAENGFVVIEGRDIGTVVFPNADIKFYLDASAEIRGKRRYLELKEKGKEVALSEVIEEVKARDERDSKREHSPLRKADDAIYIDTGNIEIEDLVKKMIEIIKKKIPYEMLKF